MINDKLEGIQVARAIAALTVVLYHAKLILIRFDKDQVFQLPFFYEHGEVGVPVFFVISGFIIAHVIQRPSFSTGSFTIRRFWRLWPLYAVCTLAYAAIYMVQRNLPPAEIGITFESLAKALTFYPQGKFPVLHPGWSLEHEVIFYLYAAIIAGIFGYRTFFIFMLGLAVAGTWWWNFGPAKWDWHLMARANGYFFIGMALHLLWGRFKIQGVTALSSIGVGLAMIVGGMYFAELFTPRGHQEVLKLAFTGLGSAALLYGLLAFSPRNPVWKSAVWIGDRSYSLYLSHFLLIPIFQTIHRDMVKWPEWAAEPLCIAFVGASILLAWGTYVVFEKTTATGYLGGTKHQ